MKTVCIVPIKSNSKRIKGKNFRTVGKKPLYRYLLDKLNKTNFNEIYIDSDSEEIKNYCKKKGYKYIKRLKKLTKDNANGNDLLNYHAKIIDADIYFQLFVTAPLLSSKTINKCIRILKTKSNYDSIFTVKKIYSWFWFKKKPINYSPKILPRSQDAEPIICETTGLYGIKKKSLKRLKARIGKHPFMHEISKKESLDIDDLEDLNYFKHILKI